MRSESYKSSRDFYQARVEPFMGWLLQIGFSLSIPEGYPRYPDDNAMIFSKGDVDVVVWFSPWCLSDISISQKGKAQYIPLSTVISRRTGKRLRRRRELSDSDMAELSQGLAKLPEIIEGRFVTE
jgi:hypothetical protein